MTRRNLEEFQAGGTSRCKGPEVGKCVGGNQCGWSQVGMGYRGGMRAEGHGGPVCAEPPGSWEGFGFDFDSGGGWKS